MKQKNRSQDTSDKNYKEALTIVKYLDGAGYTSMLAGGCVRDRLLKKDPKDFDVATTAKPLTVLEILKQKNIHTVPTGIAHGTVTAVMPHGPVEITTLRRDVETFGRKAKVSFDDASFREDASRRDFTINALYEDLSGNIHDFFGGIEDIQNLRLRFVGDAKSRIREDYLRILRFFRFWARLDFEPDQDAIDAIKREAAGLKNISQERITSELRHILGVEDPSETIKAMIETGVWQIVLPEATVDMRFIKKILKSTRELTHPELRFLSRIALTHVVPKSKAQTTQHFKSLVNLRLSIQETKAVNALGMMFFKVPPADADRASILDFLDATERATGPFASYLNFAHVVLSGNHDEIEAITQNALDHIKATEENFGSLRRTPLPVTGHDLQKVLGMSPGPECGALLETLKKSFRNGEWQSRDEILARLKK